MLVIIICNYCGLRTEKDIYNKSYLEDYKCTKCGDKDIIVKDASKEKVDQYVGCPEFTKKGYLYDK